MSLPTSVSKQASGCVVLRVKRKREEDPAEALVVAKHNKLDTGTSVFHFVGTLREDASDGVILDRLKHYRDRSDCVKSNPFARLTLEDTKTQTRDTTKRFKVTSQLRCLQEECGSSGGGDSCSPVTGDGERVATATAAAATAASGPTGVEIHICDVHQDDSAVEDCDWSSLSVYEPELVHDIIDDMEEACDDEDDSNDSKLNRDVAMNSTDEDNWRNDYPDEEGSTHTSDSELDDCGGYRHRQARYNSDEDYRFDDYL
ncbi:hypothetical protein GBAR_LOCUS8728 [Geodia barretti]|uniref:RNA polymerase II nuclear localization protein SLC7A6OS n=1 Tax=Geodia barretti TaxID=519541 RepID=A0AA35RPG9_GEOBA|nr:hypothetical protein GBAR_LOCUS8728 [Geodia barretti]